MNTILKIARRAALPHRPLIAALTLPRRIAVFEMPVSARARYWASLGAIAIAISAAVAYVAAVNVILLAGEAMRDGSRALSVLSQERAVFSSILVSRESPRRLEADARARGMVEAVGVRFLAGSDTVALLPRYGK